MQKFICFGCCCPPFLVELSLSYNFPSLEQVVKCKEICVRKGRRQKVDFHREALRRNASQEKAAAPIVEAGAAEHIKAMLHICGIAAF